MHFKRKERTVNPADPTELVTYEKQIGPFEIIIDQFFGDVTARIYFRSKQLIFTSPCIHPTLNKFFERIYNRYEQEHCQAIEDQYSEFCWYCGSLDLRECDGYAGEPVGYCADCSNVLWEADPTPYIS